MPSPQDRSHAITKSQSLGGFYVSKVKAATTNSSLKTGTGSQAHLEDDEATPVASPVATPSAGRKTKTKLGNLFKWFSKSEVAPPKEDHISCKAKKTQALRALERTIFSNGTSINNLKTASSVDSICSVGSTASFSYVPIYKKSFNKVIPLGPTCGQDTYKQRVDQRRKRVVQDLNVSLSAKYKLQPAENSPPATIARHGENLSAISGPALPSGPHLPINDLSSSSSSDEEESTLSNSFYSAAVPRSPLPIVPKERVGQIMQPKTIKPNSLLEIGSTSESFNQLARSDTMKGIQPIEDMVAEEDTISTAPTIEARPYAHIPGKRKAPKAPPPQKMQNGESNYERLGKFAKVNKVQKIAEPPAVVASAEVAKSPKLWFKKAKAESDNTIPQNGLIKSKSSANNARPISLLASISDFDKEAAKIVQQRQKEEEARRRVNDEAFYVKEEPQDAIDQIMSNVEQKMECLDAIQKHNDRWVKRFEDEGKQGRESIPSIDMNGLVSDLNQFLNTTKKEMMTPKVKRKEEPQQPRVRCTDKSKGAISKVKDYEETWSCSKCTLINATKNKVCILCGASYLNVIDPIEANREKTPTIFDAVDNADSEEMPQKGNVLDRVVQFTAIQMLATERPTSAMTSRTESKRNSGQNFEDFRPMSAMASRAADNIFVPTPIVHRIENSRESNREKRLSVLEKDETTEIIARWKKEHEEREKARKAFFESMTTPKASVIETQAALLEQAKKKLDQSVNASAANAIETQAVLLEQAKRRHRQNVTSAPKKAAEAQEPLSEQVNANTLPSKTALNQPIASAEKEKLKPEPSVNSLPTKFDPSKTPSAFIQQDKKPQLLHEEVIIDHHPEVSKEALRKKRLEYFESIQNKVQLNNSKSLPRLELSEVKKVIDMEEKNELIYDTPISPPKRVPDQFFSQRNLPHPFKRMPAKKSSQSLKRQNELNNVKAIESSKKSNVLLEKPSQTLNKPGQPKNRTGQVMDNPTNRSNHVKMDKPLEAKEKLKKDRYSVASSVSSVDYEPIIVEKSSNKSSAAKVVKTEQLEPLRPARQKHLKKKQQQQSVRKVDEIDDMLVKQVVVDERKNSSGAIPKNVATNSEIVDDVLYISGPLKREGVAKRNAFPLIPSDKFDPKQYTLTRVKQQQQQQQQKQQQRKARARQSNNNRSTPQMGAVNNSQEFHVEATIKKQQGAVKSDDEPSDIMGKLEAAIASGNHKEAAMLAKEVSKLQITNKLSLKEIAEKKSNRKVEKLNLNMYVEDRTSYNGPVQVAVKAAFTVAELKEHVQCEFEIPVGVQKWILGKSLAEDDSTTLASHGITQSGQSIYLYLVAPKEEAKQSLAEATVKSVPRESKESNNNDVRKGRYWNYEEDRWSYCSSEDEDDEEKLPAQPKNIAKKTTTTNINNEEQDDDYEWEYFYEDAEPKAAELPKKTENVAESLLKAEKAPEPKKEPIIPLKAPNPKPVGKTQRVDPRDGWECPTCTLLNEPIRPGCEACTTERPKDYQIPPPGPADTIPRGATALPTAAPEPKTEAKSEPDKVTKEKDDMLKNYKKLDDLDIIPNVEAFECIVCYLDIEPGDGVVLRECLHTFCKDCLAGAIEHCDAPQVICPYKDDNYSCDMTLLDREIKSLVSPAVYEKHQQKSLKEAQVAAKNSFHCKTPDCQGWCFITDNLNLFKCPICQRLNCITCQAIHEGQDCKQYQQMMLNESQDENSIKTKQWIEGLISTGEALNCPSCQVILLKKWGCDWVRCTYCRTEICWVTKQLRWGPNGKGDTSGGCKCMADGRTKCHPLCNYCH